MSVILPHIYYTVSELASVKDSTVLNNLNVKVLAYINEERAFEVDLEKGLFENSDKSIQLDLRHISYGATGVKPYVIFGVLYFVNHCPVLSVKSLKPFHGDFESLIVYHHQLLEIRKRSSHFQDLSQTCVSEVQENV